MKHLLLLLSLFSTAAQAQTFLERLQKPTPGQGIITVKQDPAIAKLVDGPELADPTTATTERTATRKEETEEAESDIPIVDLRKKVMRNSYKTTGYRVQAFAGGNTRADRQRAEQIGNEIKMKFPDQPIYVHFYSPRWICRVGNYRTYEEAHQMLQAIQDMGHKQASIVKGKITVQY